MADLIGAQLGSCTVIRRLGGGGMGEIYLAEQHALHRQVAVKVIRPLPEGDAAAQQAAARRFIQEAQAVAVLEHPNILPIYEFGEYEGANFLVMQYVPDGSLADLLAAGIDPRFRLPMEPGLVAGVISQVAAALQFAHDRGIIHLDVKPGNMLVRLLNAPDATSARPHMLLADFGLARLVTRDLADTQMASTPLYAAPEQVNGHPVPASDQYALAGVAFQMLTGQPLFAGSMLALQRQHLMAPPPLASSVNPRLPRPVDAVLARALAKQPEQRYPSVAEFAKQLQAALASPSPQPRPTPGAAYALGNADTNAPTIAGPAFTPGPAVPPSPAWARGSAPSHAPVPSSPRKVHANPPREGRRAQMIIIVAIALVLLIGGGILAYAAFDTTTVVVIKHVTHSDSLWGLPHL